MDLKPDSLKFKITTPKEYECYLCDKKNSDNIIVRPSYAIKGFTKKLKALKICKTCSKKKEYQKELNNKVNNNFLNLLF